MEKIVCENCLKKHTTESLRRVCSNCFLCTGCEIYKCPKCGEEIVITPLPVVEHRNHLVISEGSGKTD